MSVAVERQLRPGLVTAPLIVGNEALAAGRDPFHRAAQPPRRPGHNGLFGIMLAFVAKATADVRRDEADRGLRQSELRGDGAAELIGDPRRAVESKFDSAA